MSLDEEKRLREYFTLKNGIDIYTVYLGDLGNSRVQDAVKLALGLWYRHVDDASAYDSERDIGQAISESGVPRQEIFGKGLTDMIYKAETLYSLSDVVLALDDTLINLQLDYGKNYNISKTRDTQHKTIQHPPGNGEPLIDCELSRNYAATWKAMEALVDSGKAKSIGLSDLNLLKTKKLLLTARIISASQARGITIMAHQPLDGRPVGVVRAHADVPPPTEDSTATPCKLVKIAAQPGKSPAQMTNSWAIGEPSPTRGPIRFLDPSPHIGFDILDEVNDQPVDDDKAPWD
ncbi:aldo-keto reductase [Biscogniauxia mediterranea]|nr:aldo-keto reductase [Biscogniauxia mediterranea]